LEEGFRGCTWFESDNSRIFWRTPWVIEENEKLHITQVCDLHQWNNR
jgi:hypothetical protein